MISLESGFSGQYGCRESRRVMGYGSGSARKALYLSLEGADLPRTAR